MQILKIKMIIINIFFIKYLIYIFNQFIPLIIILQKKSKIFLKTVFFYIFIVLI